MNGRMQGLDAAVHHFRKAGELADVEHFQSGVAEGLARAAGRNQLDVEGGESARKIDHAGLIGHRNQGAGGAAQIITHHAPICVLFAGPELRLTRSATMAAALWWQSYGGSLGSLITEVLAPPRPLAGSGRHSAPIPDGLAATTAPAPRCARGRGSPAAMFGAGPRSRQDRR